MNNRLFLIILLIICGLITGCQKPQKVQYDRQLPAGELALRKIVNPAELPDFTTASYDVAYLKGAIENSLNYLNKPSSKRYYPYGRITHQHAVASLEAFKQLIESGLRGSELNRAIYEKFDVYISVGCDDKGTVLFTGYYTPIIDGSEVATERFTYPLYSQPDDLVKDSEGKILGRRTSDGQIEPYPVRAEIERSKMLAGSELIWLEDPFEVYIAHVQGSAMIKTSEEELVTVGYAANNGYDYESISMRLVEDGKIRRDQLSLSAMIDFFRGKGQLVTEYTNLNPRYVFFQQQAGPVRGSLNEPVTDLRTIATDKSIYPRACLAYLETRLPREINGGFYNDSYSGFVLDQDTGGAIRAPGRCDVYMGQGETAGKLAGQTYQEGSLYYLFLKHNSINALSFSQAHPKK